MEPHAVWRRLLVIPFHAVSDAAIRDEERSLAGLEPEPGGRELGYRAALRFGMEEDRWHGHAAGRATGAHARG